MVFLLFLCLCNSPPNNAFSLPSNLYPNPSPSLKPTQETIPLKFSFPLDDWQLESILPLAMNSNVICTAPTGSGKTLIGLIAIHLRLLAPQSPQSSTSPARIIYTTPLKALSNQKFNEFVSIFGVDSVGLLTGDTSINRSAKILVATTEVYRNILWRSWSTDETLSDIATVIFDEFHYFGIKGRGTVWEESIILSPKHVQICALSATVPNAQSLARWMSKITGRETTVLDGNNQPRSVPLMFSFATKKGIVPLFADANSGPGAKFGMTAPPKPSSSSKAATGGFKSSLSSSSKRKAIKKLELNPALLTISKNQAKIVEAKSRRGGRSNTKQKAQKNLAYKEVPEFPFLVDELELSNRLPAIFFVFSRAKCESHANTVASALSKRVQQQDNNGKGVFVVDYTVPATPNTSLLDQQSIDKVSEIVEKFNLLNPEIAFPMKTAHRLTQGVAVHTAAILPRQKQLIEELFRDSLLKVCFATETLAAGMNLPVRTAVICSMVKRTDDGLQLLTTSSFLQMAGRAGRRGLDVAGDVIVLATPFETVHDAHKVVVGDVLEIESQFAPSFGLVVNLLQRKLSKQALQDLLENSFANFGEKNNGVSNNVLKKSAWSVFLSLKSVLKEFGCVDDADIVTNAGNQVGSLGVNNPVLLVACLRECEDENLDVNAFAGFVAALTVERRRNEGFNKEALPTNLVAALATAGACGDRLFLSQFEEGGYSLMESCPVELNLDATMIMLVMQWASGISWLDLVDTYSGEGKLEQGDICRVLYRVLDALRQIKELEGDGEGEGEGEGEGAVLVLRRSTRQDCALKR